MKDHGFLEERDFATAADILHKQNGNGKLVTISRDAKVSEAVALLTSGSISQLPVIGDDEFVGSLVDSRLLARMIETPEIKDQPVSAVMDKPFTFVTADNTLDVLSSVINRDNPAVMVRDENNEPHIITQHDLLKSMAGN
jgi:cystathionine beta-synthase